MDICSQSNRLLATPKLINSKKSIH